MQGVEMLLEPLSKTIKWRMVFSTSLQKQIQFGLQLGLVEFYIRVFTNVSFTFNEKKIFFTLYPLSSLSH